MVGEALAYETACDRRLRVRSGDMKPRSICVFCGSAAGRLPAYARTADALGRILAERSIELVYGGGNVGLMGILADSALSAGGRVTGVIPRGLADRELAHHGVSELHVVDSMHARKALMAARADAFIALPGGIGTFEELFEMLTWNQLRLHAKPCGLLDTEGYWQPLLAMLDHAVGEGFLKSHHRNGLLVAHEPETLLAQFAAWEPPRTRPRAALRD